MPKSLLQAVATCVVTSLVAASTVYAQNASEVTGTNGNSSRVIMSQWTVKMPFEAETGNPKRIAKVLEPSLEAIKAGQEVVSVNGIKIGRLNALQAVLRMSTNLQGQTELPVRLGVNGNSSEEPFEELVMMPIIQYTVLMNGMQFESEFVDQSWVTTLTKKPGSVVSDLEVGDRMVSFKGEPFDRRDSVASVFQRERRKDMMDFEVVYARNGSEATGGISFYSAEQIEAMAVSDRESEDNYTTSLEDIVVMSQWSVRLPMSDDTDDPYTVHAGDRVVSVNGIQVGGLNAVSAMLRLSMTPADKTELPIDLGIRRNGNKKTTNLQISLPIVQNTVLGNGLRFETVHNGDRWQTTLVDVPKGVKTDMKVGDTILAYGSGEPLNRRTSLAKTIENDRRKGMLMFDFYILRDGEIKKCYLGYT